ncbi:hypothetical protein J1N35_018116 [Gossypium stocksii]|uniref:Uncharacterized protein n=1 Tax=Gossypium stocksii TaxID=47602 RepID=A0A9D3VNN4_9ROSI|nr:hypothetical protein J1N35_018116 [Gossypium stocksii]
MGKGGASNKVMANVLARYKRVAATLKFKRRKVSAVRDFPLRCERVTASNFGLCKRITVDQSCQGKCINDYSRVFGKPTQNKEKKEKN